MMSDGPLFRQPGESARAHEAFSRYYEMGPDRAIPKVAALYDGSPTLGTVKRWAHVHRWASRVRQAEVDVVIEQAEARRNIHAEVLEGFRLQCVESSESTLDLAQRLHQILEARLELLQSQPDQISAGELAQLLRVSVHGITFGLDLKARAIGIDGFLQTLVN